LFFIGFLEKLLKGLFVQEHRLSKSKIIEGIQCQKRLWLTVHHPEYSQASEQTEERQKAGLSIHDVFRSLYPDAIFVSDKEGLSAAIKHTQSLIDAGTEKIFEATFAHEGLLIRVDLLEKYGQSYKMFEVKSSTSVKEYHIPDAAVQAWVIEKSGLSLHSIYISRIDNSFVYPGANNYVGLFFSEDITIQVRGILQQIPSWIKRFREMLDGDMPSINAGDQCYDPFECPYCNYCTPAQSVEKYPIEILPGSSRIEKQLLDEGYADLREVSSDRFSNERHLLVWQAVKNGAPQISRDLPEKLGQIAYPRYYLDFETITFAAPIWIGTRPYQQLPFQYSCHVEYNDSKIDHLEFLDTSGGPPMRKLAEQMILDLGKEGPVITYGHFEKMIITILSELFPDIRRALAAIQDRIYDLLPLLRNGYYHPDMNGSWSIKAVLPTVSDELSYEKLEEVHDGMEAQAAFLETIHPDTTTDRKETLRKHMLKYCGQDTLALVKIVHYFTSRI